MYFWLNMFAAQARHTSRFKDVLIPPSIVAIKMEPMKTRIFETSWKMRLPRKEFQEPKGLSTQHGHRDFFVTHHSLDKFFFGGVGGSLKFLGWSIHGPSTTTNQYKTRKPIQGRHPLYASGKWCTATGHGLKTRQGNCFKHVTHAHTIWWQKNETTQHVKVY